FAFLSGTSAYLLGRRLGSKAALSKYLVTRGLILVLLELTVIRIAWTFNFHFDQYLLAGVIWMLGWCMVLMGAVVWLPTNAFGAVMTMERKRRDNICVAIGVAAIVLFFLLRTLDGYGDPRHWRAVANAQAPAFLRYINTTKYPASLDFLLMTLGPTILLMP